MRGNRSRSGSSERDRKRSRAVRIHELAQQVAAGTYRVEERELAEALVRRSLFHQYVRAELLRDRAAALPTTSS